MTEPKSRKETIELNIKTIWAETKPNIVALKNLCNSLNPALVDERMRSLLGLLRTMKEFE